MVRESLQTLREQAAKPVIERLREHREEIEELERRLFDQLETRLFDPALTAKSWRRECRQTSNWAVDMIEETVGTTLALYLEELRIETAMRLFLLVDDDVSNAEVGQAVGYLHASAFGRAFTRHSLQTPAVYRRKLRKLRTQGAELPDPAWVRSGWLTALAEGKLDPEVKQLALEQLEKVLGVDSAAASEPEELQAWRDLRRWLAERVLPLVRQIPLEQALRDVVLGAHFETPALCEHLFEQSREMGGNNPEMGVQIAELALRHAYGLKPHLGVAEYAHLVARAWAWLGDARRQALDGDGAVEAFLRAQEYLGEYPPPPAVITEVFALKSALDLPGELDETPARWRPN